MQQLLLVFARCFHATLRTICVRHDSVRKTFVMLDKIHHSNVLWAISRLQFVKLWFMTYLK